MKHEYSSLARCLISGLTWFASQNEVTEMNRKHVERAKTAASSNPLWAIAVAMAIFFAAAAAIVALI
jgi:hypothetical protein